MNRIVYELRSILERLDLRRVFPLEQPLEVELGSGDGSFLVEYAKSRSDYNFIGVERLLGRMRKMERKAGRAGLTNLRGIRIESSYFLRYLLPPNSAAALHIYFPDPWPKRKHRANRLINERFPPVACAALSASGIVYLRTDDRDYFSQMREVFAAAKPFKEIETPQEISIILTDFERNFQAQGVQTLRAAYKRL